jgi:beta-glucosidase
MKKLAAIFFLIPVFTSAQVEIDSTTKDYKQLSFWNADLSFEKRVNDLISRLTWEEKVTQMMHGAPAIPRLGIPAYDWWNEVLHGVARTGYPVTSFPQAIGMAATWDTASLRKMADISASEGRAIFNKTMEVKGNGERYHGLTYWTPNINIFRDPRWGRGQETYGEDPFLTAKLARSFVTGLQGNDPKYLKAAACAKHFAVHSGPEPSRHSDNFNPSAYDLWDTYLPAFRELVVNAKVAGVMCAYNAIYTQPCCASDKLMNDILRRQWKFRGYVTSDCWAVDDFFRYHKTHKDARHAAIDALIHGTDLECGNSVYRTLIDAVKTGAIKESQLDISLKRLFLIRFRLGMFDPSSKVKYAQINESVLEAPEHQAHALKMAQQSIVLLRNENNTLPLSRNIRKIAVLGPNADNSLVLLGNYNGTPTRIITVLEGLKQKLGANTEIIYEKAIDYANDTLMVYEDISRLFYTGNKPGVTAEFFSNEKLEGDPVYASVLAGIDQSWAEGKAPAPGVPAFHFSARYTTDLKVERDDTIHFEIGGDDGYRVYIDSKLQLDTWLRNRGGPKTFTLPARKDSIYRVVVEFFQSEGPAAIHLRSGKKQKTDFSALNQRLKDAEVILFVGGISPQLEGEEMPVAVPGFKGGDRTSILLPAVQTRLLQSLKSTGKPIVFVMMTGSALAIPWESENIPAILNAWYGGQSAGTAFADVLFGDYNPAGRLPVTFYKSDSDLPDFGDYNMSNRTYRYFKGEALYPFGYGLSYTNFNYSNLTIPATLKMGGSLDISVSCTNTGNRDGEEVVQLYVSHPGNNRAALRALKGFQRIFLKAGETKFIRFRLYQTDLSVVNEKGVLIQSPGKIMLAVGGGQPGVNIKTSSNVVTKLIIIQK